MGSAHEITQALARKDLHAPFPGYDGWEREIMPGSDMGTPGESMINLASMFLFCSILAIGTFATLLIVW
jgi:hypothetical protein